MTWNRCRIMDHFASTLLHLFELLVYILNDFINISLWNTSLITITIVSNIWNGN